MPIPGADSPATQVLLDDASGGGTWPYDITTYVELQYGYSNPRGRSDEVGDVQPSTLGMTLNNSDGRFTLGTTGGGYGTINTDRRIQVKETVSGVTTTRFTGYVQDWPVEWPGGSPGYAVATINAVDRLTRLNRRVLRSIIEQEILLDSPVAYYTLGEPAGSTSAADSSGKVAPNLAMVGSGTAVVFGNATGPGTDGLTAATFANGKYLKMVPSTPISASGVTVLCAFNMTTVPSASAGIVEMPSTIGPAGLRVLVESDSMVWIGGWKSSGGSPVAIGPTGQAIGTNETHVAAITVPASGANLRGYLDGTDLGSDAQWSTYSGGTLTQLTVGAEPQRDIFDSTSENFAGVVAHVAVIAAELTPTQVAAVSNAMLNGFNTERSDQRIARLASYANIPTADQVLETGVQTDVPHFDITGMSPTAAMQEVVNSEDGLLFLRGDGKLVFQNRTHRAAQVTPDLTITADAMGANDRFTGDMQRIINTAAVTRSGGAGAYAVNAASLAAHEQYPTSMDLKVATDAEATDRANWEANAYPEPLPRLGSLTLDLLGQTVAVQQAVMALEISDRIRITDLPAQTPGGTTADLIVEGWTETVSSTQWTMQLNVTPWAPNAVWVLEDPVYGQYDAYPLSF